MRRLFVGILSLVAGLVVFASDLSLFGQSTFGQSTEPFQFVPAVAGAKLQETDVSMGLPVGFELAAWLHGAGLDAGAVVWEGRLGYGDPRVAAMAICVVRQADGLCLYVDRNRDQTFQADEAIERLGDSGTAWSANLIAASFADADRDSKIAGATDIGEVFGKQSSDELFSDSEVAGEKVDPVYPVRFRFDESTKKLLAATAGTMNGQVRFGDRDCEARYEDRSANGQWFDAEDRLFVDLNGDGKLNPISERLPCQGMRTIGGTLYAIAGDPFGRTLAITTVVERGTIVPRLEMFSEDAELISVSGSMASESGIKITFDRLDQPLEVPIGRWYLSELRLEVRESENHYRFVFNRLGGNHRAEVVDGVEVDFELLGDLKLTASVTQIPDANRGGVISIHPTLRTESGCYLRDAKVGRNSAGNENRLTSTSRFGNNAVVLGSSGFS
ncbi:MAG: hypothetical protein Q8M16_14795 [Pirellulaceae bacterium]|nr:hypothetical protein [Pirellulaceae bacterium]